VQDESRRRRKERGYVTIETQFANSKAYEKTGIFSLAVPFLECRAEPPKVSLNP
jgi:hypothetical protein